MKLALVQICSGDNPTKNLGKTCGFIREAARAGAELIVTPEVTNCVSQNRDHQRQVLQTEAQDLTLAQLRKLAEQERIWLLIGSLALKNSGPDDRFSNRSFLIDPHQCIQLIITAAKSVDRVLSEPTPVCHVLNFGESSIDLELRFWIADPTNGVANVKSQVLLEIWDSFKANQIEIPYPQRDLHIRSSNVPIPTTSPTNVAPHAHD